MRDIKFRAWDKFIGEWLDMAGFMFHKGELVKSINFAAVVDPAVMQYTGLKDRNGTEIYEGDIVAITSKYKQVKSPKLFEVVVNLEWDGYMHDFVCNDADGDNSPVHHLETDDDKHQITNGEVIGNIYENGDLLK